MVLNSDFILLHKQSPLDRRAWAELLDFSAQEAGYIDESIKAGEGLLIAGGARIPIKDDFPKGKLYDLFNTKPEEIAAVKRASKFADARQGRRGPRKEQLPSAPGRGRHAREGMAPARSTFDSEIPVDEQSFHDRRSAELAAAYGYDLHDEDNQGGW